VSPEQEPEKAIMTSTNGNPVDDVELARLGIERVQTERFDWRGYRYSNARDAIAAAKRGERK
jgi:hypothetical protein